MLTSWVFISARLASFQSFITYIFHRHNYQIFLLKPRHCLSTLQQKPNRQLCYI